MSANGFSHIILVKHAVICDGYFGQDINHKQWANPKNMVGRWFCRENLVSDNNPAIMVPHFLTSALARTHSDQSETTHPLTAILQCWLVGFLHLGIFYQVQRKVAFAYILPRQFHRKLIHISTLPWHPPYSRDMSRFHPLPYTVVHFKTREVVHLHP